MKNIYEEIRHREYDLYCKFHNHTTKVLGLPARCEKCIKEEIEYQTSALKRGKGK